MATPISQHAKQATNTCKQNNKIFTTFNLVLQQHMSEAINKYFLTVNATVTNNPSISVVMMYMFAHEYITWSGNSKS